MDNILKNRNEKGEIGNEGLTNVADPTEHVQSIQKDGSKEMEIPPEDLDTRWLRWKCLVCGYVYEGATRLKVCPKCGNSDPDKFEDAE